MPTSQTTPTMLTGKFWIDGHLLVETRPDAYGGWFGSVMNNGVVIWSGGGGAAHPRTPSDIERLARSAQKSLQVLAA